MREAASHGRYFPIAAASLASTTKDWRLTEKMRLVFRNPGRSLADARVIARLRPGRDLVVFSLPIEVAQELGSRAAACALSTLARWKDERSTSVEGRSRAIVVYMPSLTQLRVVEHRIKYSRGKFGAGEGLATSRKARVTSKIETELAVLPI
jgi:hypothetical protein